MKDASAYPKPWGCCFVGAYVLHLYCANDGHGFKEGEAEFGGATKGHAMKYARKAGWTISEEKDIAICPTCKK